MRRMVWIPLAGCFTFLSFAEAQPSPPPWLADWETKMQPQVPRGYVCQLAAKAPEIDGKPDDPAWAAAAWTEDFVDIEGSAKPRPRFRTRAKMLWDERFFYIAAEMEEPHVWATLRKHDSVIFQDPDFEVFIDPNGDSHEYGEFEMNALNTGWDLFLAKPYKDGVQADDSWEIPGLKTAAHVRGSLNDPSDKDEGWTVEIAIPWKALSRLTHKASSPQEGDQWRLNFSRVEWQIRIEDGKYVKLPGTPEDNWVWSAQGVIDMHRPERWGCVQFTRKNPGETTFVPDVTLPARDALQEVYYAQKSCFDKHQHWASTFEELELKPQEHGAVGLPTLKTTDSGFESTVDLNLPGKHSTRWMIRQDSLVREVTHPGKPATR